MPLRAYASLLSSIGQYSPSFDATITLVPQNTSAPGTKPKQSTTAAPPSPAPATAAVPPDIQGCATSFLTEKGGELNEACEVTAPQKKDEYVQPEAEKESGGEG
jgi:hypothetical protein